MKKIGVSHHVKLKKKDCAIERFDTEIRCVIQTLRDLRYEHLCVEKASDSVDFIQTVVTASGLYTVEIKTADGRFLSAIECTCEQAVELFYEACVLKKPFEQMNTQDKQWHDFKKAEHLMNLVDRYEDKKLQQDEEAVYIDALLYLYWRCGKGYALELLAKHYEKMGDEELAAKYELMLKGGQIQ